MAQQTLDRETGKRLLAQVREGMAVYDRLDHRIGAVKDLYFGAADDPTQEERGEGPESAPPRDTGNEGLVRDLANVFAPNELPEEVQQTLLRDGFIRIDGLFSGARYALPEHIESVTGDHVRLRITRDELIKSA